MLNTLLCFCVVLCLFSCQNEVKEVSKPVVKTDSIDSLVASLNIEHKKKLLHAYFDSLHKRNLMNGNVLIAQKGVVIYQESFGYANYSRKDTNTANTSFQLASISKQFTAMAVMMLKEEGKLSYEDSIQMYFPQFPYHGISIRMLLSHRSGLPNYIYFFDNLLKGEKIPINYFDVIDSLSAYHPMWYAPPNKRFEYNNTNYAILAAIVDKASGIGFTDFVTKNIFDTLGMRNTFFYYPDSVYKKRKLATGYLYRKKEAEDNFADYVYGDKGIYTTTSDLFKWHMALCKHILVSEKTQEEAFEKGSPKRRSTKNYGFGWRLKFRKDGSKLIYHRGWWHGFQNVFFHMPEDEVAVIVFRNKKTRYVIDYHDVNFILLPEKYKAEKPVVIPADSNTIVNKDTLSVEDSLEISDSLEVES